MADNKVVEGMRVILEDMARAAKHDSMPSQFYSYNLAAMMVLLAQLITEQDVAPPKERVR